MMDELVPLDGNAIAGELARLFAVDLTSSMVTCEGCGREEAFATLKLYGGRVGSVLRCPECDAVNVRLLVTASTISLDMRGCTRLAVSVGPH